MNKIVFRCDSSSKIGRGHVTRCLALAQHLSQKSAHIEFICRAFPGNQINRIIESNFSVHELPWNEGQSSFTNHYEGQTDGNNWLGVPWKNDVLETIEVVKKSQPDLIVIDHYGIDQNWEKTIRPYVGKILIIDDVLDRHRSADIFLNQSDLNYVASNYKKVLADPCQVLTGPEFALLGSIYRHNSLMISLRNFSEIRRVLIYFGDSDEKILIGKALEGLISAKLDNLEVDLVATNPLECERALGIYLKQFKSYQIHSNLQSLVTLISLADFAIGASGSTSWERLYLRLPSVLISLSENQAQIGEGLNNLGVIKWLGRREDASIQAFTEAFLSISDAEVRKSLSMDGASIVDGRGVYRVTDALHLDSNCEISAKTVAFHELSKCNKWCEPLFKSFGGIKQFSEKLVNSVLDIFCFNVMTGDLIIGMVLLERKSHNWELDFALSPAINGKISVSKIVSPAVKKFFAIQKGDTPLKLKSTKNPKLSISFLTQDSSWINNFLPSLVFELIQNQHSVTLSHKSNNLQVGDICFLLGCEEIISLEAKKKFSNVLVVHESDLPAGRGWSPLTWQVLEGSQEIIVSLIDAAEKIDQGAIYAQTKIKLNGTELLDDLRRLQFVASRRLCMQFISSFLANSLTPVEQIGSPSYYPRRTAIDSKISLNTSLKDCFNLLRVSDKDRYPAWFEHKGRRFKLILETHDEKNNG